VSYVIHQTCCCSVPATPEGLIVTDVRSDRFSLSWNSVKGRLKSYHWLLSLSPKRYLIVRKRLLNAYFKRSRSGFEFIGWTHKPWPEEALYCVTVVNNIEILVVSWATYESHELSRSQTFAKSQPHILNLQGQSRPFATLPQTMNNVSLSLSIWMEFPWDGTVDLKFVPWTNVGNFTSCSRDFWSWISLLYSHNTSITRTG